MLHSIRAVYERQVPFVRGDPKLEQALEQGLRRLIPIFVADPSAVRDLVPDLGAMAHDARQRPVPRCDMPPA
jgi:hypothetical protein